MNRRTISILAALIWIATLTIIANVGLGATINVPDDHATIQAALAVAEDGDTVLVQPGDYQGGFTMERAGVTLEGAEGVGFHVFPQINNGGISVKADRITVRRFRIIGSDSGTGLDVGRRMNIRDCVFTDLYIARWNSGFSIRGTNHLFADCEIYRPIQYAPDDADYGRINGIDHIIRGNFFHGGRRADIGTSHTDNIQSIATAAAEMSGQGNILFEGNIFADAVQGFMFEAASDVPMEGLTVRGNLFINQTAHGIAMKSWGSALIEDNLFHSPDASFGVRAGGGNSPGSVTFEVNGNVIVGPGTAIANSGTETVTGSGNIIWQAGGVVDGVGFVIADPLINAPFDGTFAAGGSDKSWNDYINAYRFASNSPAVIAGIGPRMLYPGTLPPTPTPTPTETPEPTPTAVSTPTPTPGGPGEPGVIHLKHGDRVEINGQIYIVRGDWLRLVPEALSLAHPEDTLHPVE